MPIFAFFLSPVGRWLGGAAIVLALLGGIYVKGRADGRTAYKSKIEREITNAVKTGDAAREKALRDFDALPDDGSAGSLPDDGFRRP